MDIFLWIRQVLEPSLCCIKAAVGRLAPETAGTTAGFARQTTGTTDYADAALLGISVTAFSGTVALNGVTVDAGATIEFAAENGALLTGAFSVNCGSSAGVALIARTFRS